MLRNKSDAAEDKSRIRKRVFNLLYAYMEQQELLELVSLMNYSENTSGLWDCYSIDCHPVVLQELKYLLKDSECELAKSISFVEDAADFIFPKTIENRGVSIIDLNLTTESSFLF